MSKKVLKGKDISKSKPNKPECDIKLTEQEIKDCKEAFDLFDLDNSGTIDPREVQAALNSLGNDKSPTIFRILSGIEELGAEIDFDSFLVHVNEKLGNKDTKEGVERILELFDAEGTGNLTLKAYRRVSRELGEAMTEEEMINCLERISSLGKSELTLDDFYRVMVRKVYGAPPESVFSLPANIGGSRFEQKKDDVKIQIKKEEVKAIVKKEDPKTVVKKEDPKPVVKNDEPKVPVKREEIKAKEMKEEKNIQSAKDKKVDLLSGIKENSLNFEKDASILEESKSYIIDEDSALTESKEQSTILLDKNKINISIDTHDSNITIEKIQTVNKTSEKDEFMEEGELIENFSKIKSKGIVKKKKQKLR